MYLCYMLYIVPVLVMIHGFFMFEHLNHCKHCMFGLGHARTNQSNNTCWNQEPGDLIDGVCNLIGIPFSFFHGVFRGSLYTTADGAL